MSEYSASHDQLSRNAKTAARTGIRIARTASKAKKAASGIAKVKKAKYIAIALAVALFAVILISAFYAGPMAIFERLQGFSDKTREAYESEYYSSDINNGFQKIAASFRALIKGLSEAVNEIWSAVSGSTFDGEGNPDADIADNDDLLVMGESASLHDEYEKKIEAVKDKYDKRTQRLKESVEAKHGELAGYVGATCFPRDRATFLGEETEYEALWNTVHTVYRDGQAFSEGYSATEDMFVVEYNGLNTCWNIQKMTNNQAVDIIALCTAQFNNSPANIKPSQLMKYMGYFDAPGDGPCIESIGGSGISSVPLARFTGAFMPQYLIDEMVQSESDYSQYGAPAVDALIEFSSPNLASLTPSMIEDVEVSALVYEMHPEYLPTGRYNTKLEKTTGTYYDWFYTDTDTRCSSVYVPELKTAPKAGQTVTSLNKGRKIIYKSYTVTGYEEVIDYSSPIYAWQQTTYPTYQVKKIKLITYTANFAVMCRKIGILEDLAGFYDGEKAMLTAGDAA